MSDTPKILYKYRGFDAFMESIIASGQIKFSTARELNDPFEKFFGFSKGEFRTLSAPQRQILDINDVSLNGVYKLTAEQRTKLIHHAITGFDEAYGIFSLCEVNNSLLMHALYGGGFSGVCIGFEWEAFNLNFVGSVPPVKNRPHKVTYLATPPMFDKWPTTDELIKVYATKSEDFAFEKEWRIFYTRGVLTETHSCMNVRGAIRELILGHNTTPEQRAKIINLASDLNDIKFFVTKPAINSYDVQLVMI